MRRRPGASVDAFISYSHAADSLLAPELERGLQRLARPWHQLRAISVFRDQSDLSLTPHLWPTILTALDGARWFVLLASPASAASVWVGKEITHWCESKGVERVLLVLTDGELDWDDAAGDFSAGSTAVNPALRGRFVDEPLHLDLRWARESPELSLSLSRFRAAVAQVASPIRGMPPDEIEGEDIRLHRRARRLARTAVSALAVLTVAATVAAVLAVVYGRRAEERAREATGRQVGLAALALPARDLDQALLLTLAAAELDSLGANRFRPARTKIGQRHRLQRLVSVPDGMGRVSLRTVALTRDGKHLVATASRADGSTRLIDWDLDGSRAPRVVEVPVPTPLQALPGGSVLVGAPGGSARVVDPDGAVRSLGQRVLAVDEVVGQAVVVDAVGGIGLVDLQDTSGGSTVTIAAAGTAGTGALGEAAGEGPAVVADTRAGAAAVLTADGLVVRAGDGRSASTQRASAEVVAVTADGAITATADGRLTRWRIEGTRLVAGRPAAVPAWLGAVRRVVPAPGGERVLAVGRSGTALLDVASGALLGSDRGLVGPVSPDPSGRYVAVGGARLTLWDLEAGSRELVVPTPVRRAAWNRPCTDPPGLPGCRLVTVGERVDVWEPVSGRRIPLEDQTNAEAVAFLGDRVATAGWGDTAAIWSGSSTGDGVPAEPFTGRRARLSGTVARIEGGGSPSVSVEVADGARLVQGSRRLLVVSGSTVRAFDMVTGVVVPLDAKCSGDLVAVSPDGSSVAMHRVSDGATSLCRLDSGALVARAALRGEATPAAALAVEDGGGIVLGGNGAVERFEFAGNVWNQGAGVEVDLGGGAFDVRWLSARAGVVAAGLTTPGGTGGGRVLVWDAGQGGPPVFFESDQVDVPAVSLLGEQAELVAVAGRDADDGPVTVTVWESATRIRIGRGLLGLSGEIGVLSGDLSQVYGTDASGRALRWPLDLDPHDDICEIVGRGITEQEWGTAVDGALADYPYRPLCP